MAKRRRVRSRVAKRLFSRTAARTRSKNVRAVPMRGGYRI